MANIQIFGPLRWVGSLRPGESVPISTDILVPEPSDSANLVFVVTARALRTSLQVKTAGIGQISVVTNDSPGGLNLNFPLINTHPEHALEAANISIAVIS
jgi:hypothetical protein